MSHCSESPNTFLVRLPLIQKAKGVGLDCKWVENILRIMLYILQFSLTLSLSQLPPNFLIHHSAMTLSVSPWVVCPHKIVMHMALSFVLSTQKDKSTHGPLLSHMRPLITVDTSLSRRYAKIKDHISLCWIVVANPEPAQQHPERNTGRVSSSQKKR